jgi:hypothetical protein
MRDGLAKQLVDQQDKMISKLHKEIETLKSENKHLKELIENTVALAKPAIDAISDEELIASAELRKLKELSQLQVLTYEECKKVVEYSKILQSRKKPEEGNSELKGASAEDLLTELLK